MHRMILAQLQYWMKSRSRKPLLIRGARQVGKSYVIAQLGQLFETFVTINFELAPDYKRCFNTLDPHDIVNSLALITGQLIIPGKTLLFFDEVQVCPAAIQSLRYFKENMPELHVIAAGSLLEFALHNEQISMPVGRVEYLYMMPCSFDEFLLNSGNEQLWQALSKTDFTHPISDAVHHHLLKLFKDYMIVGGMPEAMQTYIETHDLQKVQRVQNSILQTYRDDFGKYANIAHHKYLQTVYDKVPGMVGTQISYQKIDAEFRSRDLKNAIVLLEQAGVVKRIFATSASGLPLSATLQEKKFKLHFLDVGLVQRKMGLNALQLLDDDIMKLNAGALAEQVVAQELLTYQDIFSAPELFFWASDRKNAQAEIDYVLTIDGRIVPLEVKSGATGHLKSLHLFLAEKNIKLGIKVSIAPLSCEKTLMSIPIYMLSQLNRLYRQAVTFTL